MRSVVALCCCCCLLLVAGSGALKQPYLQRWQPCSTASPDGTAVGLCRGAPQATTSSSSTQAAELVIDMSLPCSNRRRCSENVDAAEKPLQPPVGAGVRSCSVSLLPWSPFPCSFNSDAFAGKSDQNVTDLCYAAQPSGPEYALARSLTTDGYSNVYTGVMPETPCGPSYVHAATIEDAAAAKAAVATTSAHGKKRLKAIGSAAALPPFGRHFVQVVLTLDFRVAAGRQFDRTYALQIGQAVVAMGTCSEPTRFLGTDKQWRVTLDVTHLQAHFAPGQPVRFSLANLLSSTYNVPIWASAKLEFFWLDAPPSSADGVPAVVQAAGGGAGAATPAFVHSTAPRGPPAVVGADVPDEVLPLVPAGARDDATVSLSGNGDRPKQWPRATFELPASLSEPGNIYRAQLLVTPKANGCEEFWAMTPSGSSTNSTCPPGGPSTGEPYREVRVYVNGQLAGFSPIYYTMYTGGIDPRLWSAVVASYSYSLPQYTFDLSPWLPQLNSRPAGAQAGQQQQQQQQQQRQGEQADMPSTSRRLAGITVRPPATDVQAASDQRLPPKQAAKAATTTAAADGGQSEQQQQQPQQPTGGHTITVELGGASGSDWILANTLLLWRAGTDENGQPITVTGEQEPSLLLSPGFGGVLSSDCSSSESGASLAEAGRCVLEVQNRGMLASAVLQMQGSEWLATVQHTTKAFRSDIAFNSAVTDGSLSYAQSTRHEARWSVTRLTTEAGADGAAPHQQQQQEAGPAAAALAADASTTKAAAARSSSSRSGGLPRTLTQSHVRYEWLQAGGVSTGAVYEMSYNSTLLQPSVLAALGRRGKPEEQQQAATTVVGHGRQRHYQRAVMTSVYDQSHPTCDVPDHATHTAELHNSISAFASGGGERAPEQACFDRAATAGDRECVARKAAAAFCSASLLKNVVDVAATGC